MQFVQHPFELVTVSMFERYLKNIISKYFIVRVADDDNSTLTGNERVRTKLIIHLSGRVVRVFVGRN